MLFAKEHLAGLYHWEPENVKTVFEGSPTRRIFDRYNGNQVYFIINSILERTGASSVAHGRTIEKLILNKLPFETSSELTVFNWLEKEMMMIK